MTSPQEHYFKVGSLKARCLIAGEGSPLVLLHGAGGSGSGWLTCIGPLSARHRVYAPDLPGHGRTDKAASGRYTFDDLPKFISNLMTELGIEGAHLVGHSLGGAIALRMAIDSPGRVRKLVLISSAGLGREISPLVRLITIPRLGEILAALGYTRRVKEYARRVRSAARNATHITDELMESIYRVEQTPGQYKTTLKVLRSFSNWRGQKPAFLDHIRKGLPSIKSPTLVMWGRQDDYLPYTHGEKAVRSIPDARLEVFDPCGHLPMFEYPERVNKLILDLIGE